MSVDKTLAAVADVLARAQRILFVTGAGISVDSGLPTYRGIGGLYHDRLTDEGLTIEEALSGEMMATRPEIAWRYIAQIESSCRGAQPNAAHRLIAALEQEKALVCVLTQNVDGLHQAAGSPGVLALHGNLFADPWLDGCALARRPADACPVSWAEPGHPPRCAQCGSLVRPAVVWFGEGLPVDTLAAAQAAAHACEVMLVVGTSGQVWPAAGLAGSARRAGARVIVVNPDATALDDEADALLRGPSASVLPRLLDF